MPTNSWSFVYVIAKGYWAKVGSDIYSSLEMTGLQNWSIDFFLFICSQIEVNFRPSTFKTFHFKASRDITTNFDSGALHINKMKDQ